MDTRNVLDLLTTGEAARLLDRSSDTVRSYERHGKLRAIKTPRGVRLFELAEVLAFKADRESKQAIRD